MFVLSLGTTGIGFNFAIAERSIICELWNGIIGFPVVEAFGRPVCYLLNRFSHCPFQNLGSSLANLVLGVSSSMLREGSPGPKSIETVA